MTDSLNPQSEIFRNPKSATERSELTEGNPNRSEAPVPHTSAGELTEGKSAIRNPQSAIRNPQSNIP
jgi:hypothetical protein